jgi:2-polyprenyl-3-methyl-5-hydroxy-6-metoxy-1,4-benzoquinol methylase
MDWRGVELTQDLWMDVLIESLDSKRFSPHGDQMPAFPPEELQRNTTGLSSEAALRQAYAFYEDTRAGMRAAGKTLDRDSKVLDFGFGWGRISRVFMHDVKLDNIHGVDVDAEFVELTRRLFGSDLFTECSPFPPTRHDDASFDLIYAYSVFSHLSGAAVHAWMTEFERLLKPGGVVAFTTRHDSFFDFCEAAANRPDAEGYVRALGTLFPDFDDPRARYRRGELVHASSKGVSGAGPRNSTFYGETWIPEVYVRGGMGTNLEFVAGHFDGTRYDQACFVMRKSPEPTPTKA